MQKLPKDFLTFCIKTAQNFDMLSYFAQILRKMLAFVYFIKFRETIPENDE